MDLRDIILKYMIPKMIPEKNMETFMSIRIRVRFIRKTPIPKKLKSIKNNGSGFCFEKETEPFFFTNEKKYGILTLD